MELVVLLVIVIFIGALLGGNSFGGTVRKGCGFLLMLVIIIAIAISVLFYSRTNSKKTHEDQEVVSTHFTVKENCLTYIKPNIESEVSGKLEIGKEFFIENVNKYKYFYEITNKNGKKTFVRKNCLKIKAKK